MLNMDFSTPLTINTNDMDWEASPANGVWRKPLAREAIESGHATSIVKYDPGASFSGHNHPLGEEILVLHGVFSDETGDFPAGTYFRNPRGFIHAPFSKEGCVLLVKLHQFQESDISRLSINTNSAQWDLQENGVKVLPLHQFKTEQVSMHNWPARLKFKRHTHKGGEEVYVISGELKDENGSYPAGSWIRNPDGSVHEPYVEEDTLLWIKTGHLLQVS